MLTRLLRIAAALLLPSRPTYSTTWPIPSTTPGGRPAPPLARPRLRPPYVAMPPDPGRRPWPGPSCPCGKKWTATTQGYAAADRHNDLDLPECGAAWRQQQRNRAAVKRALIAADPVLAEQQRAYDREMSQREWARIKADPERLEGERAKARETYRRRRSAHG